MGPHSILRESRGALLLVTGEGNVGKDCFPGGDVAGVTRDKEYHQVSDLVSDAGIQPKGPKILLVSLRSLCSSK